MGGYHYSSAVLAQLGRHGVRPTAAPPPQLVHDFVNDLYRYELRRFRDRQRQRQIRKADYYDHVVELRRRYPLLSLKPQQWVE